MLIHVIIFFQTFINIVYAKNIETYAWIIIYEEINSLDVYCINKGRGCGWQGRLDSIDDHLAVGNADGCQFHEFQCPYNCGKILQRRYMIAPVA